MRKIFHKGQLGISFGIDVDGDTTYVAFAFCNPNDQFTKARSNVIVNRRLDFGPSSRSVFEVRTDEPIEVFNRFMNTINSMPNWMRNSRRRIEVLKEDAELLEAGVHEVAV